jgi:methionyl-tRNA synthetase
VMDPFQVMDLYGADALRYYLLRDVSFGQDGSISPEDFEKRYVAELANEYGNLASRTLAMIGRYRDGEVPAAAAPAVLASDFDGLADTVRERLDAVEPSAALDAIWQRVRRLNQYVQDEQPWQLAKDEAQAEHLDSVLYGLAEGLRVVSVLAHPFMPAATERLLGALGADDRSFESARFGSAAGGTRIGALEPLFPKVEAGEAAA